MWPNRQDTLISVKAAPNIQDHLLRVEWCARHISRTYSLAASTFVTGIPTEQLKRCEIGQLGNAKLLDLFIFKIKFGELPRWFERTKEDIEGAVNDMSQWRIKHRGDKHNHLCHMKPPQHPMSDQHCRQIRF